MINRFNHIRGVGNFRNFSGGASVPFGDENKISVVYGRNTLGKSTLASIFESIATDKSEHILNRMSLPLGSADMPNIEIRYKNHGGTSSVLKFKAKKDTAGNVVGAWEGNELKNKIYVFDQDFIHRHLMSGTEVTRKNKEELTDFILGEEGVKLSQEIENDNSDLLKEKSRLGEKYPPYAMKQKMSAKEAEAYSRMIVTESIEQLKKEKEFIEKSSNRLRKVSAFNSLPVLTSEVPRLVDELESINNSLLVVLNMDYKNVNEAVKQKVSEHIKQNCHDDPQATLWIKQGQKMATGSGCPFCGQTLDGAEDLLNIYQSAFDGEFEKYDVEVKRKIQSLEAGIDKLFRNSVVSLLADLTGNIKKFDSYVSGLEAPLLKLNEHSDSIRDQEHELTALVEAYRANVRMLLDIKKRTPHLKVENKFDTSSLFTCSAGIDAKLKSVSNEVNVIIEIINKLKLQLAAFTNEQIEKQLLDLNVDLKNNEVKIARLEDKEFCEAYILAVDDITKHTAEIKLKSEKLDIEQSAYLIKYFSDLNKLFSIFGSSDFQLSVGYTNQGKKKIYSLNVSYRGEKIKPELLNKVFSESDKRSLALAIYFCKVSQLSNRDEVILVLDDPVVSFDDNRIGATTGYIQAESNSYKQTILLTHYKLLVEKIYSQIEGCHFLEICSTPDSSKLTQHDVDSFTLTPHESDFEKISKFIDGDSTIDVRRILRPYMEQHLRILFAKQISGLDGGRRISLSELIKQLNELGCYDESVMASLTSHRTNLNPDHHTTPVDENPMETRTNARNLFTTLYEELV